MTSMDTQTQTRWFHPTPGRFVLALLAVEVLLWLSDTGGSRVRLALRGKQGQACPLYFGLATGPALR